MMTVTIMEKVGKWPKLRYSVQKFNIIHFPTFSITVTAIMFFVKLTIYLKIVSARKNWGNREVLFIFQFFVRVLGGGTFWGWEIDLALAYEAIWGFLFSTFLCLC